MNCACAAQYEYFKRTPLVCYLRFEAVFNNACTLYCFVLFYVFNVVLKVFVCGRLCHSALIRDTLLGLPHVFLSTTIQFILKITNEICHVITGVN